MELSVWQRIRNRGTNIYFLNFQPLKQLTKVMKECWFENAAAGLSALRIKKTLALLNPAKVLEPIHVESKEDLEKKIEAQG